MLNIILTILIGFYGTFLLTRKRKPNIGEILTRRLRLINLGLLTLVIILIILGNYNIFLRGYYTTKIIFWLLAFSAMTLFAFGYNQMQGKLERLYYGAFFYFPLTCIPLSFIPFLGWGVVLSIQVYTIGDPTDIEYSDGNYRLQRNYRGFLAPAAPPDLFVKRGLFEYKEKPLDIEYLGYCDSLKIDDISDKKIKITFYHSGHFTDSKAPFELMVDLEN